MTSGGKALRAEVAKDAVVYFRPKQRPPLEVPDDAYVLATEGKDFVPRVLPVIVGATVRFPNFDPILHNAFSTSQSNSFDVGLYGQGEESEPVRFVNPGLVRVYCNVHHGMVAHILVLRSQFEGGLTSTVRGVFTYRVNDDGLITNLRGYWNLDRMQFGRRD